MALALGLVDDLESADLVAMDVALYCVHFIRKDSSGHLEQMKITAHYTCWRATV
jgi:hypothetical protein